MIAPELYQAIGGAAACRRLSETFYARVQRDPALRRLFPGKNLHCAINEFSAFLAQFLGAPAEQAQARGWLSLRESHARFEIGIRDRELWLGHMRAALEEAVIPEPARAHLRAFFEHASAYLVDLKPPARLEPELAARWQAQVAADAAIAAIRAGDAERAIALSTTVLPGHMAPLLAAMIAGGNRALLAFVREKLLAVPPLLQQRFNGRTLLHIAAAAGNLHMVEFLLAQGADANAVDGGGHPPLYAVANGCKSGGADIVRALAHAGAAVNACEGVKRCTPLHMAARRGNVEIAEALIASGAALEARDSLGDTPLRRAVNCARPGIAALLIAKGADPHSIGSKGLTPLTAARSVELRRVLAV